MTHTELKCLTSDEPAPTFIPSLTCMKNWSVKTVAGVGVNL